MWSCRRDFRALWCLGLLFVSSYAWADVAWLEAYAIQCQRGSLGRTDNPLRDYLARTRADLNSPLDPEGSFALESDIADIFRTAPEFRDLAGFKKKWKLSEDQALDILSFYGTRMFFHDAEVAGNVHEIFSRLQQISREHYIGDGLDPLSRKYLFYSINLTKFSVPELAKLQGIPEGQVYKEIRLLGLSLREAFADRMPEIKRRVAAGETTPQIAQAMRLGEEALEFILHHERTLNRGVDWNRALPYRGQLELETVILVDLQQTGLTYQQIADELNRISGDAPIRTEQSVSHKLQHLGLTEPNDINPETVLIPGYGLVKSAGKLNENLATHFIFDHFRMSDEWLAGQLGVEASSLQDFMIRHHIVRQNGRLTGGKATAETQKALEQYQKQRSVIRLILDWVKANGRIPIQEDFRVHGAGKIGIQLELLYGPDGAFAERHEAMRALKIAGTKEGIDIKLIDIAWKDGIPPSLRAEFQQEAVDRVVAWIKTHGGKVPTQKDFGHSPGKVGLGYPTLFGLSEPRTNIFDSRLEAMKAIKASAKQEGISLRWFDFHDIKHFRDEVKNEIQAEALAEVVNWMKSHGGKIPIASDFNGDGIAIQYNRFYASGDYRPGAEECGSRIFDTRLEAITALKKAAADAGINVKYSDFAWKGGIPDSIRPEIQQESISNVIAWMRTSGGILPNDASLRQIGIDPSAFFGRGPYKAGKERYENRIFDSRQQADAAIIDAATAAGVLITP